MAYGYHSTPFAAPVAGGLGSYIERVAVGAVEAEVGTSAYGARAAETSN